MFAIVDIETTGGHASANGITEIAIAIHDGEKIVNQFSSLINPQMPIPPYIQALTGINHAMVSQAPLFDELAKSIFDLLHDKVFVAHNVNFDYSFVKHKLAAAGYDLDCKKLCTVRMSRKLLPGHASYSLGKLCASLGIQIEQHHRAEGDVMATVQLFEKILAKDKTGEIIKMLKAGSREKYLPPHVSVADVDSLPSNAGVYYFHNSKGKVVYVGKAKDLKKRVTSHFSNNKPNRQKQDFLREVHNITYQNCGSELMAFILESIEIKRLWPLYNRSLKTFQQAYALYQFEDGRGYNRLAIEKKKKHLKPLYTFNLLIEGMNVLKRLITDFALCPRLCFIDKSPGTTLADEMQPDLYNARVQSAIEYLHNSLPTFAIVEKVAMPTKETQHGIILMEKGRFYGMGYGPVNTTYDKIDKIKEQITHYPETDYIRGLIYDYANKHPGKRMEVL